MSLFQLREWWGTQCGVDDSFDTGCLAVGNIDNCTTGDEKLVVGSFGGFLRIYFPSAQEFTPVDLLYEENLGAPILQVSVGRFVQSQNEPIGIAILHPRSLVVYSCHADGESPFHVTQEYVHRLEHTACCMTTGPFGGVTGKDIICVQSMDGEWSFFEHDSELFRRFLGKFLVPGPVSFVERTDSLVTVNSGMELEAYKFHMLAVSTGSGTRGSGSESGTSVGEKESDESGKTASSSVGGKKIQVDWTVNLGEHAIQVLNARYIRNASAPTQRDLIVVGEQTLFVLRENGVLAEQKRLHHPVSCAITYPRSAGGVADVEENILLGTHDKLLMVYSENTVRWTAHMDFVPVDLAVATCGGVRGMVVSLSETGRLMVGYLGTDPAFNPPSVVESKEPDYEAMEREHKRLKQIVREHMASTSSKEIEDEGIILRAQVPMQFEEGTEPIAVVKLFITNTLPESIHNLQISFDAPQSISPPEESITIPEVPSNAGSSGGSRTPLAIPVAFRRCYDHQTTGMEGDDVSFVKHIPHSLKCTVMASCRLLSGEPKMASCEFVLPSFLMFEAIPPVKTSAAKITIDTNRPPVSLNQLFDELGSRYVSTNVLSVRFATEPYGDCTILMSKSGRGRYRIQSSSFEGLWLLTQQLVERLETYFGRESDALKDESGPFAIYYNEALPIAEFFEVVDDHFALRLAEHDLTNQLSKLCEQFRAIQKRLLVRFRDRNALSLASMDELMEITQERIMKLSHDLDVTQRELMFAGERLYCGASLLLLLVRYRNELAAEEYEILRQSMLPSVDPGDELGDGWEERVDASMTHLLRTSLARNARESASVPTPIVMPPDTSKVKKHISLVLDRVSKGKKLISEKDA